MRVAILEWICGGGMHAIAPDEIPASLANEGRAMLGCLLRIFSQASADVVSLIDTRIVDARSISRPVTLAGKCELLEFDPRAVSIKPNSTKSDSTSQTIEAWISLASNCDMAVVVAPEIDGILQRCISEMKAAGIALLNCSGDFLDIACSKYHTAKKLHQAGLAHPRTLALAEFHKVAIDVDQDKAWCIKSDLGAGCDGLHVGQAASISQLASEITESSARAQVSGSTSHVIQPWIAGTAYSCSAVVDRHGKPIWFPLVTQSFQSVTTIHGCSTCIYQGGKLLNNDDKVARPTALLNQVVMALNSGHPSGAFGWVGVDLLLDRAGNWIVIEVNPRMTTSVIGLSQASPVNLAELMLAAFDERPLPDLHDVDWKLNIAFNACGLADTI